MEPPFLSDLVCLQCGTAAKESHSFCGECGASSFGKAENVLHPVPRSARSAWSALFFSKNQGEYAALDLIASWYTGASLILIWLCLICEALYMTYMLFLGMFTPAFALAGLALTVLGILLALSLRAIAEFIYLGIEIAQDIRKIRMSVRERASDYKSLCVKCKNKIGLEDKFCVKCGENSNSRRTSRLFLACSLLIGLCLIFTIGGQISKVFDPYRTASESFGESSYTSQLNILELEACERNLTEIDKNYLIYSTEHSGQYPSTIEELTPAYMESLPICPASGRPYKVLRGFSVKYNTMHSGYYLIMCEGENHIGLVPANFPQIDGLTGLIDWKDPPSY